jgi:hypothetical protein
MCEDRLHPDDPKVLSSERVVDEIDYFLSLLEPLDEHEWDAHLVGCLLKSARRAHLHLQAGWHTDSTYLAWACRNLLELRIFAAYVVKSPENRVRFTDDMTVDSNQSTREVVKMAERDLPGSTTSDKDIVQLLNISNALTAESGYDGKKFLGPKKLAKELGLEHEWSTHKLCSKLVHPTAQSILLVACEGQDERDAFFLSGSRYLVELVNDLGPLVEGLTVAHSSPLPA